MGADYGHLKKTCTQLLQSLLASRDKHVLCLNIAEEGFSAEQAVMEHLKTTDRPDATLYQEPSPRQFAEILEGIGGKIAVVNFEDLDKHPKCLDALAEHVRRPDQGGGKLVVVSRFWNSDNTAKERELRKFCLFYQRTPPPARKEK